MFNKSFWAMKQDLEHGHGIGFSLFGGQGVASGDKQAILDFNSALEKDVKPAKAWATTMSNASISAQNLTRDTLRTKGNLKELANGLQTTSVQAKAASIGLKALSVAGNMLISLGISFAISALIKGIDYLIHREEKLQEALNESISEFNETTSEIKDLEDQITSITEKIKALQKLKDAGTISVADEKELENLKKENEELARNLALKQSKQASKAKDALEDAKKTSDSQVKSKYAYATSSDGTNKYRISVSRDEELMYAIEAFNNGDKSDATADRISDMYEDISPTLDAYRDLIDAGIKLEGQDKETYERLKKAEDAYLMYSYAITGTKTAFEGLTKEQKRNILTTNLLEKGISEEYAKAIVNSIQDEDLNKFWDADFSFTPPTPTDYSSAEEYGKAYAEAWLNSIQETVNEEANKIDVSSILSGVQSLSDGLDQLDKIYADVKDGEYFDFSSILNNKEFTEAFGDLGESYENFIETITNSPSDIKACQSAFNDLSTAYINNSGALANVTEETKNSTIAMLKQMGVANAEEIVINQLKAKTLAQSDVFKDLTSATLENTDELYNNVQQLIAEADASGITISAMADLVAQQQIFNNQDLDVNSKIQSLAKLASAFGAVADAANISAHQQYMATEISMAYRNGASASDIESIKNGYLKSASSTFQNAISAKFGSLSSKINYTGGSKTNGGSSKSQSEKEFNWIETLLSRIQNKISDLGKTASATWKSWTNRNNALKSQISAVTQEINLQANAANKYLSLANSVGLGEGYKSLVRNGALDISTISDENTINAIKQYQEYYENYLSALDAKQDAEDELRNLKQTSADNISTEYDDLVSFIEHEKSMLDSTADILENKGYMASASIYDKLIQYEYDTISKLEEKYKKLNENLNNSGIQQGTEQWNDMKLEILEVEEAILESQNALVDYNNTLRELDWEVFDKLQEKISGITEEADFLIKLMSDEKMFDEGKITEHGQATLGLYVLNYKTYLAQAEEYGQKLEEIREDLKNDPYNQTLIDQEKEWAEALRDSILASDDALQSIVDLKQEGYDSLLESLDTAIDKYKDLINEQKNAYDYQKQIDNLTGDVTKYQKITKSLEGMKDTEEGKKLIQEYSVKLKESEEALAEAENEKYLDDLDKLLQNLSDDATEFVSQKMDNVDALVKEVIAQTETNTGSILETLKTETSNVNTTLTSEMEKVWGANGTFTTSLNSVVDMFKQYFDNLQKEADTKASEIIASTPSGGVSGGSTTPNTPTPAPSTSSSSSSSSSGWGSWFINKKDSYPKSKLKVDSSIVDRLKSHDFDSSFTARAQYYRAMGGSGNYVGSSNQNRFMINSMKSHGFAQGGTIGNLIKATGEDGFVLARKGEGILTPENMKMLENVMITMNPIVDSLAKLPSLPDMRKQNGDMQVTFGDIQMYGVNDPVEFEKQLLHHMKNSHPIRKVMKDTTIGEALGKNPMIRYTR